MQKIIQQLQQQLQSKQMEVEGRVTVAKIGAESRLQEAQMNNQAEFELEKMKLAMSAIDKRLEKERNQIEVGRLQNERAAIMSQMRNKEREMAANTAFRVADHQQRQKEHADTMSNPSGSMAQTLSNDRYNMGPGAVG